MRHVEGPALKRHPGDGCSTELGLCGVESGREKVNAGRARSGMHYAKFSIVLDASCFSEASETPPSLSFASLTVEEVPQPDRAVSEAQ